MLIMRHPSAGADARNGEIRLLVWAPPQTSRHLSCCTIRRRSARSCTTTCTDTVSRLMMCRAKCCDER